jgi:hypothetical protein
LDELILWLASQAANLSFVSSEGVKLVKLVEAGHADRPIPLVRIWLKTNSRNQVACGMAR